MLTLLDPLNTWLSAITGVYAVAPISPLPDAPGDAVVTPASNPPHCLCPPHRIYGRHETNFRLSEPNPSRSSKDIIVMPAHAKHNVVWGKLTCQPQVERRAHLPDV